MVKSIPILEYRLGKKGKGERGSLALTGKESCHGNGYTDTAAGIPS